MYSHKLILLKNKSNVGVPGRLKKLLYGWWVIPRDHHISSQAPGVDIKCSCKKVSNITLQMWNLKKTTLSKDHAIQSVNILCWDQHKFVLAILPNQ